MELRNIRLTICVRNTCAQFSFEHLRLSVCDLLTRLISMYELAYCVPWGAGGVLPYMGHIGMRRCEGYGFQAVYSLIGYINQRVKV